MKVISIIFALLILTSTAFGSASGIICGSQPGEIYFNGVHPSIWGFAGYYCSTNYGRDIELKDSVTSIYSDSYGVLFKDAADSVIYLMCWEPFEAFYISEDYGLNWTLFNTSLTQAYASGVIPGEIYRRMDENHDRLERSQNQGVTYVPCTCNGFPDSSWIYSASLGVDPGEVYIWGYPGLLYYSDDYSENFTFLGYIYSTWGINYFSKIINGAEPGEIYAYSDDFRDIWRIYNYGANAELCGDFAFGSGWYGSIASSDIPGELYYLAIYFSDIPGGIMHIYHTWNYGEEWTMYEHVIQWSDVNEQNEVLTPSNMDLKTYPNPTNSAFNIEYEISSVQDVKFYIYNLLGQPVWQNTPGIQPPGQYEFIHNSENLSSGTYILKMQTDERGWSRKITIIK